MRHLRLAATELAEDLADTHGLEATADCKPHRRCATEGNMHSPAKDGVKLLTPCRDLQDALSLLTKFMCSLKAASSRLLGRQ
jgi:hypothetical protein